jgi:hypothetical protein
MVVKNVKDVKSSVASHLCNIRGVKSIRKIIVFESDDWGSIRMPSKRVYNELLGFGIPVDKCPYNRLDSIAGTDDLDALFTLLSSFRDEAGMHPVITANSVMANPDFDKIKESGYKQYYYENFTQTLERNDRNACIFKLWQQGLNEKLFYPQFHGREHVNIKLWLELLRNDHKAFLKAFECQMWGLGPNVINTGKINIQASLDASCESEIESHKEMLRTGLEMFENTFGFKSESFIANNYIWSPSLNMVLDSGGVKYIQGMKYQFLPIRKNKRHMRVRHYSGERNALKQIYFIRNASFEPALHNYSNDCVDTCIKEIEISFMHKKPAVISTHRLNYIGQIEEKNRQRSLALLSLLLKKITRQWPDVEFMTTVDLGRNIEKMIC